MIRLSRLADYGLNLMAWFAAAEARHALLAPGTPLPPVSAAELAQHTGVPLPTVGKLLRRLGRQGLLESVRGAHGGYRPTRPAAQVGMGEVLEALEGPLTLVRCRDASGPACSCEQHCSTKHHWGVFEQALRKALSGVTLADLAAAPTSSGRG